MIQYVDHRKWGETVSAASTSSPADELEQGAVLFLKDLGFEIAAAERIHFSPAVAAAKNVSFDPSTGRLGGVSVQHGNASSYSSLDTMLRRFSDAADALVNALFPPYRSRLRRARASFRPVEIAGRETTWRQDDTRLHIDSFPATPVQGQRILRVFTNVNPEGRSRSWRVGGAFDEIADRFGAQLRMPWPFSSALLRMAGITKSRRSPYDALMLQLHDCMKADRRYQAETPHTTVEFPAGSTWIAFTDCVSHAAMAGQYQLEQTFLLPVDAMRQPWRSPLRILEKLKQRPLV